MTRNKTLKSVVVDPRKVKSSSPVRGRQLTSSSKTRRSRSRSQDSDDAENPGNKLYVTGLSTRITNSDLRKYFRKEGKVVKCHLVIDPRFKQSRGFGFVTMETNDDAERCIKNLDRSVFEGRRITVEKAKRCCRRPRTPGIYAGPRNEPGQGSRTSRSYSVERWQDRDYSSSNRQGGSRSPQRKRSPSPHSRRKEDHFSRHRRWRD